MILLQLLGNCFDDNDNTEKVKKKFRSYQTENILRLAMK